MFLQAAVLNHFSFLLEIFFSQDSFQSFIGIYVRENMNISGILRLSGNTSKIHTLKVEQKSKKRDRNEIPSLL